MKSILNKLIITALLISTALSAAPTFAAQTQAKAQPSWWKPAPCSSKKAGLMLAIGLATMLFATYKIHTHSRPLSIRADERKEPATSKSRTIPRSEQRPFRLGTALTLGTINWIGIGLSAFGAYSLYCNYGKK